MTSTTRSLRWSAATSGGAPLCRRRLPRRTRSDRAALPWLGLARKRRAVRALAARAHVSVYAARARLSRRGAPAARRGRRGGLRDDHAFRLVRRRPGVRGRGLRAGGHRARGASAAVAARRALGALRRRDRDMRLRDLPSVDELARASDDPLGVDAARTVLARARENIRAGSDPGDLNAQLQAELRAAHAPKLRRVLNATGVIVHTNLGRAPLAAAALVHVTRAARGYSNLEYDLDAGARGSRQTHVADLLRRLTGAETALVVNNNAAAVLLALAAPADGPAVLVP